MSTRLEQFQTEGLVADRFRIERELGRGGMGAVFIAQDEYIDERVALKVARAGGIAHDEFQRRFEREARIGELLGRHHGFVRTYAWGELDATTLYAAMDLVPEAAPLDLESGTLEERLGRLLEVARLVGAAHERGVIHRDLKPDNVFVSSAGEIWLGDFGLAKHTDDVEESSLDLTITHTGMAMGTPYFMPAEQFEDAKSVDARADVFALGVMLFRALTGAYPYMGGSPAQILSAQLKVRLGSASAPRVRDLASDVALAFDTLCADAMSLDLGKRIPDAGEFARRLEKCLQRGLANEQTAQRHRARSSSSRHATLNGPSVPPAVVRELEPPPVSAADRPWLAPLVLGGGAMLVFTALLFAPGVATNTPARGAAAEAPSDPWETLEIHAESGDPTAMLKLAQRLDDEGETAHAFHLREEAALAGSTAAMLAVGDMYRHGYGVDRSLDLAQGWYAKAAQQGDRRGQERVDAIEKVLEAQERAEAEREERAEQAERWKRVHDTGRAAGTRPERSSDSRLRSDSSRRPRSSARRPSSSSSSSSSAYRQRYEKQRLAYEKQRLENEKRRQEMYEEARRRSEERAERYRQEAAARQAAYDEERAAYEQRRQAEARRREEERRREERRKRTVTIYGGSGHGGGIVRPDD